MIVHSYIFADYFGRTFLGSIRGIVLPVLLISAGIGAPLVGYMRDSTGSYVSSWWLILSIYLLADPHYKDRGTFVTVDHPQVGPKQYPGIPWKMSATPGQARWPSPTLGQHNEEVYGELLGLTGTEIGQLEKSGTIGTKPTGSRII